MTQMIRVAVIILLAGTVVAPVIDSYLVPTIIPPPIIPAADMPIEDKDLRCSGNGDFVNGTCTCKSGWKWVDCSCDITRFSNTTGCVAPEDHPDAPCSTQGNCDCHRCTCFGGYSGSYCECDLAKCPVGSNELVCSGERGKCVCPEDTHICQCKTGFTGSGCEIDACESFRDCVMCVAGGSNNSGKSRTDCESCNAYSIRMLFEEEDDKSWFRCRYEESTCTYSVYSEPGHLLDLLIDKKCTESANVGAGVPWILGTVVGVTAAAGLVFFLIIAAFAAWAKKKQYNPVPTMPITEDPASNSSIVSHNDDLDEVHDGGAVPVEQGAVVDPHTADLPAADLREADPRKADPPIDPSAADPPGPDPPEAYPPGPDPPEAYPPGPDPPADPPAADTPVSDEPASDPPAAYPPEADPPAADLQRFIQANIETILYNKRAKLQAAFEKTRLLTPADPNLTVKSVMLAKKIKTDDVYGELQERDNLRMERRDLGPGQYWEQRLANQPPSPAVLSLRGEMASNTNS